MTRTLARQWFLFALAAAGLVLWRQPHWLAWTSNVSPRLVVATVLFLSALGLDGHSLVDAVRRPWPVLVGFALSYGFLPVLCIALSRLTSHSDLRLGLIVTATVPCTIGSALIWTRMAGGNEAVVLLVVFLTTCLSFVVTTAWLTLATDAIVEIPARDLMLSLVAVLVVPVALGQLVRAAPGLAARLIGFRTSLGVVSQLLILSVILRGLVEARTGCDVGVGQLTLLDLTSCLVLTLGAHLAAVVVGIVVSRAMRFDNRTAIAVALAGSQKTLPVGLFLIQTYYPNYPLAIVPLLSFHVGQLILDSFVVEWWRHGDDDPTHETVDRESSVGPDS